MVTVKEFTSEKLVLSSECIRYNQQDVSILVTLAGGMNTQANELKQNTIYELTVTTGDDMILDGALCRFISYNCQYNTSVTDNSTLVVTDNTLLFERLG